MTTWVDEVLAGDPRYNILTDDGTVIHENVQVVLDTSVVTAGTPVDAEKMNALESAAVSNNRYPCNGRLTLETGVPVSTSDQADKTTLYFTPYMGNQIGLYDGSVWSTLTFTELSLNISAFTASKPYDIWAYNNSGTVALDSTVWTNGTTRATALVLQNGIYVKTGATTRRYLGTIYMDAASKCQDSLTKRFVWNFYNRVPRKLMKSDNTGWTIQSTTWVQQRGAADNKVEIVIGVARLPIDLKMITDVAAGAGGWYASAPGINTTASGNGSDIYNLNATTVRSGAFAIGIYYLPTGYSFISLNEVTSAHTATVFKSALDIMATI